MEYANETKWNNFATAIACYEVSELSALKEKEETFALCKFLSPEKMLPFNTCLGSSCNQRKCICTCQSFITSHL